MIEIHPLRDTDKLCELYKNQSVTMNEYSMAVVASDREEILGFCLFEMKKDGLLVHSLEPKEDAFFADGILRSALHVGVENGVNEAFYSENAPEKLFETLKFIKNAEKKELNVGKLFSSCQSCANS